MVTIKIEGNISTTEDCKNQLNKLIGVKKWKRLYKLENIRCFTNDDNEVVTIAESTYEENSGIDVNDKCMKNGVDTCYWIFVGLDMKEEIKAIKKIAKYYYSYDGYNGVYYNPITKKLWIEISDCGYIYSEVSIKGKSEEELEELADVTDDIEFNSFPETSFIKEVNWEAECSPQTAGFIKVAEINNID
jgi:hypothetical protein